MTTFAQLNIELKDANPKIKRKIKSVLHGESKLIKRDLYSRSPFDTGYFRSRWNIKISNFGLGGDIARISIKNDAPYAYFMEYGAPKFAAPWYYPQRDKRGRFKKGTGKLKERGGRIWAGGLNPGHNRTIGGAIRPTLFESEKRLEKMSELIAKAFVSGMS